MSDPRAGRAGQSGHSTRLGNKDPRVRTNAAGAVSDVGIDRKTIGLDGAGRMRVAAVDGLQPLPPHANVSQLIAGYNLLLAKLKGL